MLIEFHNPINVLCTARPSKTCKSPYVADIVVHDETILAHSPALGMDGYIANGKQVLVSQITNPKGACQYSILAAYDNEANIYVGANPIYANKAFHEACKQKLFIEEFGNIETITPEYKYGDSRFDFFINNSIYVEVKSVLIAKDNIAYFPVGNKKKGTISERANKHVSELTSMVKDGKQCAVVFMVLREDVTEFKTNPKDSLFCELVTKAKEAGVKVLVYQCKVDTTGISFKQKLNYM
jgi:sugar fermentation stimulation protein A